MTSEVLCKDCKLEGVVTVRKLATKADGSLQPGPRCVTHHRARRKATSLAAHGKRTEKTYGITEAEYWTLYAAQGGKCYICRFATGKRKRLAVDHDHQTMLIRGLLCGRCNVMIGFLKLDAVLRVLEYLHNPPAIGVIGCKYAPSPDAPINASTPPLDGAKLTITAGVELEPPTIG